MSATKLNKCYFIGRAVSLSRGDGGDYVVLDIGQDAPATIALGRADAAYIDNTLTHTPPGWDMLLAVEAHIVSSGGLVSLVCDRILWVSKARPKKEV